MTRDEFAKHLKNQVTDFVFLHVTRGRTNDFINKVLKQKGFPQMTEEQLNGMREFFKKAESAKPEIVKQFADRLLRI